MASLEGKLSQFGDSVILTEAQQYFEAMNAKLQETTSQTLSLKPSYLSKFEVVDDLRTKLRPEYRLEAPDGIESFDPTISNALDPATSIADVATGAAQVDFNKVEAYLNDCATKAKGAFDPPLAEPFSSAGGESSVFSVPSTTDLDPRRHARIIMVSEFDVAVKKWLSSNALLYGMTLYEDYALYFVGFSTVKEKGKTKSGIVKLVNKFQQTAIPASSITLTTDQVAKAKDPVAGDLDPVQLTTPVSDNAGNKFTTLYRVSSQCCTKDAAIAYTKMKAAAKRDGITLSVNSAFRPATGNSAKWTSASGKTGKFTTQESLRRDKGRWESSYPASKTVSGKFGSKSGDEAFIFYAGSSLFKAPTAPPGVSKHGNGVALDFNTGSRKFFSRVLNDAVYKWVAFNAHKFGFVRTVSNEEWHFEYIPSKAANGPYAVKANKESNLWYADLGLNQIPTGGGNSGLQGASGTSGGGVSSSGGGEKAILITGLTTDVSHAGQINFFKEGFKGAVSAFTKDNFNGASAAVKANGGGPVVLFSAGAKYAKQMASAMKNYGFSRSQLYIVEPWNGSGTGGGTAQAVAQAVSNYGLPANNVVTGPSNGRGKGILSQAGISGGTNTPSGKNHFQALAWLGSQL